MVHFVILALVQDAKSWPDTGILEYNLFQDGLCYTVLDLNLNQHILYINWSSRL